MHDGSTSRVGVTTKLTQWEESLLKHKVVNRFQVLRAKGLTDGDIREVLFEEAHAKDEKERLEALFFAPEAHPGAEASLEALDELEEDEAYCDDAAVAKYRELRLRELAAEKAKRKFGRVNELVRDDWMAQVNDSSRDHAVVVMLYKDSVEDCSKLGDLLATVAATRPDVKFLRIRSRDAIPNWPDAKLPVLFVYRDGELQHQLFGRGHRLKHDLDAVDLVSLLKDSDVFDDDNKVDQADNNHPPRWKRGVQRGLYNDQPVYDDDDDDDDDT